MSLDFTYTVSDEDEIVCNTQVVDLHAHLARTCEKQIEYLKERAREEAKEALASGTVSEVVARADLPKRTE